MTKFHALTLLLIALLLAACGGDEKVADNPNDDDAPAPSASGAITTTYDDEVIEAGNLAFDVYCVACHGSNAQGIKNLGVNLVESEFVKSQNDEELLAFIIVGRPIEHPDNTTGVIMPPRGGFPNLKDERILEIIAYIRSLQS